MNHFFIFGDYHWNNIGKSFIHDFRDNFELEVDHRSWLVVFYRVNNVRLGEEDKQARVETLHELASPEEVNHSQLHIMVNDIPIRLI